MFGHRDPFKNIKRKYVFEIVYGFFDVEAARVREQLRHVYSQLRELRAQRTLFETFFENTPLANRADIEREIDEVTNALADAETTATDLASEPRRDSATDELQRELIDLEGTSQELIIATEGEHRSLSNLQELAGQLESQVDRLTRAIVSHKLLLDLEFVVCPRCGTDVAANRASDDNCILCLQEPSLEFSRKVLVDEQDVVEQQLKEIQDLARDRESRVTGLQNELARVRSRPIRKAGRTGVPQKDLCL